MIYTGPKISADWQQTSLLLPRVANAEHEFAEKDYCYRIMKSLKPRNRVVQLSEVTNIEAANAILSILTQLGPVEWARIDVGYDDYKRRRPPLAVWRYESERGDTPNRILSAVSRYSGEIDWSVDRPERNWIIQPTRVADPGSEFSNIPHGRLRAAIASADPVFTEDAIQDFRELFKLLSRSWSADQDVN